MTCFRAFSVRRSSCIAREIATRTSEEGRYIAERIPGARFVELPGRRSHASRRSRGRPGRGRGVPDRGAAVAVHRTASSRQSSSRISSARHAGRPLSATLPGRHSSTRHDATVRAALATLRQARRSTRPATAFSRCSTGQRVRFAAGSPFATHCRAGLEVRGGVHTGEVERRAGTSRAGSRCTSAPGSCRSRGAARYS